MDLHYQNIKPYVGMRLKFKSEGGNKLNGYMATVDKDSDGWFVRWDFSGSNSMTGPASGIEDDRISNCWEVIEEENKNSNKPIDLKALNTKFGATHCAACGGELRIPSGLSSIYQYCPKCE